MGENKVASYKIAELEGRVKFLESLLSGILCRRCGGMSLDLPLDNYCSCEARPGHSVDPISGDSWIQKNPPF